MLDFEQAFLLPELAWMAAKAEQLSELAGMAKQAVQSGSAKVNSSIKKKVFSYLHLLNNLFKTPLIFYH